MKKIYTLFFLLFVITNINCQKRLVHDLSCFNNGLTEYGVYERDFISNLSDTVSLERELLYGNKMYQYLDENDLVVNSGESYDRINRILTRLIQHILDFENPTKFINFGKFKDYYKIHIINDSNSVNAYTIGARIFLTKGLINFSKSDHQLACVIGHEIAHNELGHNNFMLKRNKTFDKLNKFEFTKNIFEVLGTILAPFNQLNEGHSDLFGIDLAVSAGYEACESIEFWNKMNKFNKSNSKNSIESMLSTHPYSDDRAKCSQKYINQMYNTVCH